MSYTVSEEKFRHGKMFDSSGKFRHRVANKIKLFPFVTQAGSIAVEKLDQLVGSFLCEIEDKAITKVDADKFISEIKKEVDINFEDEKLFEELIKNIIFDKNGDLRPLNLQMQSHIPCADVSEEKLSEYLVDVLGNKDSLKLIVNTIKSNFSFSSNVLEKLVVEKLSVSETESVKDSDYFTIVTTFKELFDSDFEYIISNQNRAREYLVPLLELYYFSYTAQSSMQLDRFLTGSRNTNIPLYFCLDWEKPAKVENVIPKDG